MDKISTLLNIQKQSREASRIDDFGFIVANKTHDLISYETAVFWIDNKYSIELNNISGMSKIDDNGPYANWLRDVIKKYKQSESALIKITNEHENEWSLKFQYLLCFKNKNTDIIGGVFIGRNKIDFNDNEKHLLEEIGECYSQSLEILQLLKSQSKISSLSNISRYKKIIFLILIVIFCFPVRLSVTAPVEIVASNPSVLTMPYDGVLSDVFVSPGDNINVGDIVAAIDKTTLQSQMDKSLRELQVAKSTLSRASFESLRSSGKKAVLQSLKAEISIRKIDLEYAKEMLKKTDVISVKSGVAIFSDASELKGRPMSTGERIMTIANPNDTELLIKIPAQSLLKFDVSDPLKFYLNMSPLKDYDAKIISIGYQATSDGDGFLTYKVRANFKQKEELKIGWQGTAKIKSSWSIFGYSILRRPMIAFRNLMGV